MNTLNDVVVALCRDFERRRAAINEKSFGRRTLMEYKYLNSLIYDAAAEVVGVRDALAFIREIGEKTGYIRSEMYFRMSESNYKRKKSEVKRTVALKLHLTD